MININYILPHDSHDHHQHTWHHFLQSPKPSNNDHPPVSLHGVGVDPSQNNDSSHDDRRDQIPHHLIHQILDKLLIGIWTIVNIRWSHLPVEGGHPAQIHFHLRDVAQELVHAVDVGNQDDLKDNRIKTAPRLLIRYTLMRLWDRITSIDYQSCTNDYQ